MLHFGIIDMGGGVVPMFHLFCPRYLGQNEKEQLTPFSFGRFLSFPFRKQARGGDETGSELEN